MSDVTQLRNAIEAGEPKAADPLLSLVYFVGMTVPDIATALDLAPRTVDRHWAFARAWLKRSIGTSLSGRAYLFNEVSQSAGLCRELRRELCRRDACLRKGRQTRQGFSTKFPTKFPPKESMVNNTVNTYGPAGSGQEYFQIQWRDLHPNLACQKWRPRGARWNHWKL